MKRLIFCSFWFWIPCFELIVVRLHCIMKGDSIDCNISFFSNGICTTEKDNASLMLNVYYYIIRCTFGLNLLILICPKWMDYGLWIWISFCSSFQSKCFPLIWIRFIIGENRGEFMLCIHRFLKMLYGWNGITSYYYGIILNICNEIGFDWIWNKWRVCNRVLSCVNYAHHPHKSFSFSSANWLEQKLANIFSAIKYNWKCWLRLANLHSFYKWNKQNQHTFEKRKKTKKKNKNEML